MEKTTQITIASTIFQLTESAYEKLAAYLESLKAHFANDSDKEEILRDIESRIAEKLLAKKHGLVTETDIARVIADMGDASDFEGEGAHADAPEDEANTGRKGASGATRKLYRDTENAMIAGVAAGIANYFGIEATIVRLIFAVSIFFGGTGIFLYILLIFLIPEAKTASQKLEMRGDPVTLESIAHMVKDRVDETRAQGTFARIVSAPLKIISAVTGFIVPLVGKIIGLLIVIGSFFAILGATLAVAIAAANWNKPYMDAEILNMISPYLAWTGIIAGYLALVIPLMLISSLGRRLLYGRSSIPSAVGLGLVGVWCLAIITAGVVTTRVVGDYYAFTSVSPDYQSSVQELDLAPFGAVSIEGEDVKIVRGDTQSVTLEGRQMDMDKIKAEVVDGTLLISYVNDEKPCFFCDRRSPNVTITTPDLDSLKTVSGNVNFEEFTADEIAIDMQYSSVRGSIVADKISLKVSGGSLRATVTVRDLVVHSSESHVELRGEAQILDITTINSAMPSDSLLIQKATVSATDSFVSLNVAEEIRIENDHDSRITNTGRAPMPQIR